MDNLQPDNTRNETAGTGRVPDSELSRTKSGIPDISRIDRQEGDMNNGELGGNFAEKEEEKEEKEK